VAIIHIQLGMSAYLWLSLAHDAGRIVLLQSSQRLRELGFGRKGRHDRHNHVGGQVGNSGHCIPISILLRQEPSNASTRACMAGCLLRGRTGLSCS
jgi:hypothetical protein